MNMTAALGNILQNSIENLILAQQQLEDKDAVHQRNGNDLPLETFWKDMTVISQKLTFECTKIGICFTKPPVPTTSETSSLLRAVEQTVLSMVSLYYRLSPVHGCVLHSIVQHAVIRAIEATHHFLNIIKDGDGENLDRRFRQSTGTVWQGCEMLEKCPHDNKAAVLRKLNEQQSLVLDAFNEITEALEGDGSGWDDVGDDSEEDMEEDNKWTNEDKDLIGPSVNLVKAAKILYKRVSTAVEKNGSCATHDRVKELDQLYEDCEPVPKIIDTLILELYPPLSIFSMEEQSHQLANLLRTALKTCTQSHVASEDEQPHIEFLHKAINHNLDRMKEKLSHR